VCKDVKGVLNNYGTGDWGTVGGDWGCYWVGRVLGEGWSRLVVPNAAKRVFEP
jgi:hypothetical protein